MSNFKKTPARTTRSAAPTHKPGSKSPKHRGYRPAEATAAPAKKRWNAEDRAKRAEAPRADRADRRPDWQPGGTKPRRSSSRVEPVETRPRRSSSRVEPVETRPHRSNADRPEPRRSSAERGSAYRDQRPARDDRPQRADRPRYDRAERPQRADRPRYDRAERPQRADRPRYDRAEHSEHRRPGADRPARDHRDQRPRRDDRPLRDDRPRRDSDFYPKRDGAATREGRFTAHEDVVLERLEADAIQASDVVGVTFADLGLGANIVRELSTLGADSPFPIQAATIPDVLKGMDVLGRGKTGSGKTIAFGAPLVERLMENGGGKGRKPGRNPRALILAPTRELALQIDRTIQPIARSVGLFTTQIYGGVPQHRQVTALQRGVDIVIGTPGRIEDLIEQGRLDLSDVTITVLDEADHMCDLGFLEPVQRILHETAPDGQKLLFSATLDKGVASLVDEFLVNPSVHEVAGEDQASSTIDHRVLLIEQSDKRAIIEKLSSGRGKTLIFARTRAFAEQLADDLDDAGIPAVSLHGDLNQARRTRNLEKLTSGRVSVLVATDVAARGIHVDDISLVIQADPPDEYKSYLHRAGRTGRAGKAGTVVTLVNSRRRRKMDELLGRAEISPRFDHVRPGDELLEKLAAL
ncbi:DEAD/DEAH box helicase [Leifsonella bigeumensis]|uniref:DEAD/DEAH box helicase n=1 Tax=Leifsonella bigeumensis TaxID=433643 RepID=UPI0031E0DCD9